MYLAKEGLSAVRVGESTVITMPAAGFGAWLDMGSAGVGKERPQASVQKRCPYLASQSGQFRQQPPAWFAHIAPILAEPGNGRDANRLRTSNSIRDFCICDDTCRETMALWHFSRRGTYAGLAISRLKYSIGLTFPFRTFNARLAGPRRASRAFRLLS